MDRAQEDKIASKRARWLAQQFTEIADVIDAGQHPPAARRVLSALLGFGGTPSWERLARVVFLDALQAASAMRVVSLLARRDRGEPLGEGQIERLQELDEIHRRIKADEPDEDIGDATGRVGLLLKDHWAEQGRKLASDVTEPTLVATARAAMCALFPEVDALISDEGMLEAIHAFERTGGGAKQKVGTETKWEVVNRILTKEAGFTLVAGVTTEADYKHWKAGRLLDEQKAKD